MRPRVGKEAEACPPRRSGTGLARPERRNKALASRGPELLIATADGVLSPP